jgi:phage gpG-like protein
LKFTIDTEDIEKTRIILEKVKKVMPNCAEMMLKRSAEDIIGISQKYFLNASSGDNLHLHSRSGRLSSSLWHKPDGKFDRWIGSNLVYARIQHEGGMIHPGAKGFLAWRPLIGVTRKVSAKTGKSYAKKEYGDWIFTKRPVYIPGRPYITPAIDYFFSSGRDMRIGLDTLEEWLKKAES